MRIASIGAIAAVMACGEVKANHIADGPAADTAASPDATPHGTVTLKVLDPAGDGGPAVGVPVVFIDANGTQKTATDNNGIASADVLAGASVTAVLAQSGGFVESILDVQPGDMLTLGEDDQKADPTQGTFNVNANGQIGTVFGPCGGVGAAAGAPSILTMRQSCLRTPMDILLVTNNGSGQPIGYSEAPNIPFTSGGSTTMPTQTNGLSTFAASITDLGGVANVNLVHFAPDLFGFEGSGSGGNVAGATLPLNVSIPIAQSAVVETTFVESGAGSGVQPANQRITQVVPGNSTTFGLDADANLLGWIGLPVLDVTTGQVTIPFDQTTTSKDAPDVSFVEFFLDKPAATDAGTSTQVAWLVFMQTPGNFTLPQLPPELGDLDPKAGDTVQISRAGAFETDGLDGYADGRKDPFVTFDSIAFPNSNVVIPQGTTKLRFELSENNLSFAPNHPTSLLQR